MMRQAIGCEGKFPLSSGIRTESFVFISGQTPTDEADSVPEDLAAQTRLVLEKLKAVLEASGSSLDRVVKTTIFLTDPAYFPTVNTVYAEYFPKAPPSRSTICCQLMRPAFKVEIEAISLI